MRFGAFIAAHHVEGGLENDWTRHEEQVSEWLAENAESYIGELDAWNELRERLESPETYESGRAVDHYNFFPRDFELAAEHGLEAVRLSFSWSRIEPEEGVFDQEEIEHYHRVLDAMEENGLEPLLTVWHFTQPEWFADKGFWHQEEAVEDFMRFVKKLEEEFGHRVKRWVTINEATTWLWHAYFRTERYNYFPPGNVFSPLKALKAAKNMAEAHRRAYNYLKENSAEEVGASMFVTDWNPLGINPVNRLIAAAGRKLEYELFLDSIEDRLDFIGVDYYKKWDIGPGSSDEDAYSCERDNLSSGESLRRTLERVYSRYDTPLKVTENGLPDRSDEKRREYIPEILEAVDSARDNGVEIDAYYHTSLLDIWEWNLGVWPRYGLIDVDLETFEREPKESLEVYRKEIKKRR